MEINKGVLAFLILLIVGLAFSSGYFLNMSGGGQVSGVTTQPTTPQAPEQPKVDMGTIKGLFDKNLIKFGDANRKLLFVEVSDPSCPYCHVAGGRNVDIGKQIGPQFTLVADGGTYVPPIPEMKKLVDEGRASFAWIYYPGHGNGQMAAKALYCAFDQGKFWQAHDVIMSSKGYDLVNNQVGNDKERSGEMAKFLASVTNESELKNCLDSGKYDSRLVEETNLATQLGVQGTPGFFFNDTNFAGAYSWSAMKSAADAALN